MSDTTVYQEPGDHLYYDVDWNDWLTARGLTSSAIVSFTWTTTAGSITGQAQTGTVARVYIKDIPDRRSVEVTCMLTATAPEGSTPLKDNFSFKIIGAQ